MNISQDRNLAIRNRTMKMKVRSVFSLQKKSIFPLGGVLALLFTLQGCSTIEGLWTSPESSGEQNKTEINAENKGELDSNQEQAKSTGIRDLKESSQQPIKPLDQTARARASTAGSVESVPSKSIEIMWQVPTEPVEAYHIYLSSGATEVIDEKRHIRVLVSALKKEDNPTYGPVYKFLVPGNTSANTIQIRAENRFGLSEPSEPMIVQK